MSNHQLVLGTPVTSVLGSGLWNYYFVDVPFSDVNQYLTIHLSRSEGYKGWFKIYLRQNGMKVIIYLFIMFFFKDNFIITLMIMNKIMNK